MLEILPEKTNPVSLEACPALADVEILGTFGAFAALGSLHPWMVLNS